MKNPKKNVYEVGPGAKREKKNVIFARGAELLILTPAWCQNEISCDCPWPKMLTLPKFGNVVIKLGATYKMAYCREKCKEIWNVCMNDLYLI